MNKEASARISKLLGMEMRKLPLETTAYPRPEIFICQTVYGFVKLGMKCEEDYIWLKQLMLAELLYTTRPSVGLQLRLIHG